MRGTVCGDVVVAPDAKSILSTTKQMSLITIVWSMITSACLTPAAVNFLVWCKDRKDLANLFFALLAIATAASAFCELGMMQARSPIAFATVQKWTQVALWLGIVSLVGFVRVYLRRGDHGWRGWSLACAHSSCCQVSGGAESQLPSDRRTGSYLP